MYLWARWEQAARDSAGKQDLGAGGTYYHPPTVHKVVKNYARNKLGSLTGSTLGICAMHTIYMHACLLIEMKYPLMTLWLPCI